MVYKESTLLTLDMVAGACALSFDLQLWVFPSLLSSFNQWHLNCDQNTAKVGQKCAADLPVSLGGGGCGSLSIPFNYVQ